MVQAPSVEDMPSRDILHAIAPGKLARIFEGMGFVPQLLRSDDGKPAVRFMKLGIDGMALFFGDLEGDQYRIVVLNAFLTGVMPAERMNALNARGVLPKIYATESNTVVELPLPLEAGFSEGAIAYYIASFENVLKSLENWRD